MSQILYLNSVRFLFFVPSEDCSCKIHGLRVGITRPSGGWTCQVRSLPVFRSLFPCSLTPYGGICWDRARETNIHVSYIVRIIGLVQMHLCLIPMVVLLKGRSRKKNLVYSLVNYYSCRML